MSNPEASILILGAGQAAARAAQALRSQGYAGSIVMLGAEPHFPYERPPLSKAVLVDDGEPALDVLTPEQFAACNIHFISGVRARLLDTREKLVHLDDGRQLGYDRCLLATGGRVRELPGLPQGALRTHYMRSLDDARKLRGALSEGTHLAIVGGGFLGLEVASSAMSRGARVTVIESAPTLLGRFLPPEVADWLTGFLRGEGVRLELGSSVRAARSSEEGVEIELGTGEVIRADQALVAIGLIPEVELAEAAGLRLDEQNGGILVDADGRSSEPGVFAAGDCASQFNVHLGRFVRIESWQNANEQGEAAAAGMLGTAPRKQAFPWFWTDQGRHNLQMLGLGAPDLAYVRRGDPGEGKAVWIGHRDGVPVHGIALNAGGDLRALRPLFEERVSFDAAEFGVGGQPLRAWVKATLALHPTRT